MLGNRTRMVERAGQVPATTVYEHGAGAAGPHQLTSMTRTAGGEQLASSFTWDAVGNQTSRTTGGPSWVVSRGVF